MQTVIKSFIIAVVLFIIVCLVISYYDSKNYTQPTENIETNTEWPIWIF